MFYSIIGIALLLLSAVTIGCMAAFEIRDRKGDKKETFEKALFPGIFGCHSKSL